ncbi:hypothetical protein TNIN_425751 [Trichonephila inaurata madagascariensis]|uniref:Uncharacterized protein n=1 Tax=Trichonephila inaurata madagascariensis TaxID=2747483 RepID=A0A8X6YNS8_9ARAC|nr:hypothetical protein TNIN_425751 [Trichonephila inaurata madagascariensis]
MASLQKPQKKECLRFTRSFIKKNKEGCVVRRQCDVFGRTEEESSTEKSTVESNVCQAKWFVKKLLESPSSSGHPNKRVRRIMGRDVRDSVNLFLHDTQCSTRCHAHPHLERVTCESSFVTARPSQILHWLD